MWQPLPESLSNGLGMNVAGCLLGDRLRHVRAPARATRHLATRRNGFARHRSRTRCGRSGCALILVPAAS